MIFGHDFKYRIPEMDRLLGAAADLGVHFQNDMETVSYPDGRKYLVQQVMGKIGDAYFHLMVNTYDISAREETK
jgi:hypothetical protein